MRDVRRRDRDGRGKGFEAKFLALFEVRNWEARMRHTRCGKEGGWRHGSRGLGTECTREGEEGV